MDYSDIEIYGSLGFILGTAAKLILDFEKSQDVEKLKQAEIFVTKEYTCQFSNQGISKAEAFELLDAVNALKVYSYCKVALMNIIKASTNCNNKNVYLNNTILNLRELINILDK